MADFFHNIWSANAVTLHLIQENPRRSRRASAGACLFAARVPPAWAATSQIRSWRELRVRPQNGQTLPTTEEKSKHVRHWDRARNIGAVLSRSAATEPRLAPASIFFSARDVPH